MAKAVKRLEKRRAEIASGRWASGDEKKLTFDKLAEGLLDSYEEKRNRSTDRLAPKSGDDETYDLSKGIIGNLRAFFGEESAVEITVDRIAAYKRKRRAEVSPATVRYELIMLRRMFDIQVQLGALKPHMAPAFPELPKVGDNARQGFLEHHEYLTVRDELKDPDRQDFADFGYHTGWRWGAIRNLAWDTIDTGGKHTTITLPPRWSKNKEAITIPVPPAVEEILERRAKRRVVGCPLVFHRKGKGMNPDRFNKVWRKAVHRTAVRLKATDVPRIANLLFHDLRRTAVRNMANWYDMKRERIMRLVGLKTESIFERYNIVSENDLAEDVAKWGIGYEKMVAAAKPVPRALKVVTGG